MTSLRLAPVMFELGARPHPPQRLYRAYLAQSQIFVGIYWQSYGWVAPGEEVSGLHDEFLLSASLPRLIYIKSPAQDREPELAKMLKQITDQGDVSYRHFSTPAQLHRLVKDDLAVLLSERFEMARTLGGVRAAAPTTDAPPSQAAADRSPASLSSRGLAPPLQVSSAGRTRCASSRTWSPVAGG